MTRTKLFNSFIFLIVSSVLSASIVAGIICFECENAFGNRDCLTKGKLVLCEENQNACQIELRHGGWGNEPLVEKTCKQITACGNNHIQDSKPAAVFFFPDTQCNMKTPSSVCRCCCTEDGCNQESLYCNVPLGGLPCEDLRAPRNGFIRCRGGEGPNSRCRFRCRRGFKLIGSRISRCDLFSRRDFPAPTCQRIRCKNFRPTRFGSVICSRSNLHRSVCRFSCNDGFNLRGFSVLECIENRRTESPSGVWNHPQPRCNDPQCPRQRISNGEVRCTNRNRIDSTCTFSCNAEAGYRLFPATTRQNTCQFNEQWNRPAPCCTRPCPPFAVMDFVIILDSSSSVGRSNWDRMKEFVRNFIDDFSISDDATHVGVFRYNRAVDTSTQILLNDYSNNVDDLLEAFDRIPYDGSGTFTGRALTYATETLLQIGNRPEARDVVLLITDGAAADNITLPAQALQNTGALIFVLPIQPPRGRLNLEEINFIAGDEDNVLTDALEGGFEALDESFSARISSLLCRDPCLVA